MAYVFGYWLADGYMRHERSYRITFSSLDESILQQVKGVLNSNSPIFRYRRKGKLEKSSTLIVHSKILYKDLLLLGGLRKKSLVIRLPKIQKEFLADFIRGYFDGDGSVFFTTYLRTKDHRKQTDLRCNFTSGSPLFLNSLRDLLTKELELFPRKICSYGNGNQWKLEYAKKDTKKLLNFIYYPNCKLYLERKAKFLE
ncbi:MAG: hypothetical protein HYW45_02550 [Candidatus Daviesbacteria bacterium]|nr:MAG: hypothetical protein HYW45_02550 [Candidatus Daviesbacteria bacterium]